MDTSPMQSQTAATSPSSPGAGNYNVPGDNNPSKVDPPQEESKFKGLEEDDYSNTDIDMLTIEDSTLEKVPAHLANILSSFDIDKSPPGDLLIAIIYGVALECSFADINEVQKLDPSVRLPILTASAFHSRFVRLLSEMPSNVYDANKMIYTLRLQLYFFRSGTQCLMTGVVTGDLLILTLTPIAAESDGKSICLSIGRYVLNTKGVQFPSRFRKLPELSFKLREHLLVPIRKHLLLNDGIVILYPCLEGLPEELYPYLYKYLNPNGLCKMANVSKRLLSTVTYFNIYKKRLFKGKK